MANEAVFMPVLPSFDGFFNELSKGAKKGGEQAGRDLAGAMEKSLQQAEKQVDTLGKAHERAQNRAADAADKTRVAQIRLSEAMNDSNTSVSKLADLTAKYEKAQRDEASAVKASEKAGKDLTKAQGELQKATDKAGDSVEMASQEVDQLTESMRTAGEESKGFGSKIASGLGTIGKGALLGVGAKIGTTVMGGIGTAFEKGFGRLQSIEQAESMLSGLGNSAAEVDSIMDSAMEAVSGTAYGFGEAASMAATFSGAGIKEAGELTRILSLVGDTAAITGADFQEMGSIWTKIATGQRMSTEEMNQLMDRGLGILPELQKHYGVTADEARKMVTEGKVSFEDFSEIMEGMVGGSAQEMGNTFSGSAANMQAALGRLGAKILEPVFDNAPAVFQAIGGAVDKLGEHLDPLVKSMSEKLAPIMQDFAERLGPWLESTIENVANAIKNTVGWIREHEELLKTLAVGIGTAVGAWKLFTGAMKIHAAAVVIADKGWKGYIASTKIATAVTKLFNKATKANIIGLIATALIAVGGALVYFFTKTETGRKLWDQFTTALADGWEWVTDKLGSGIDWIKEKFDAFTGWISDAWNGITSLFKGDFTSSMRDAFGVEEDNPLISGFLKVHEILTGIPDLIKGIGDILFKGDFTGLPFGLEEDSGFVGFLFTARDTVIAVGDAISTVFDWILTAAKVTIGVIGTIVLTPFILAWNGLSLVIQGMWDGIIKPVWDAMSRAALAMWETYIKPAVDFIVNAWSYMSGRLVETWNIIKTAVFDAWTVAVGYFKTVWNFVTTAASAAWALLKDNFLLVWGIIRDQVFKVWNFYANLLKTTWDVVTGAVTAAWTWLKDHFIAIWTVVRDSVFAAWNAAVEVVKSVFQTVTDAINAAWTWLKDRLYETWVWVDTNVFAGIRAGLDVVKNAFQVAVEGIKNIWDGVRAAAAKPIKFVIESVFNNGVVEAWNKVADWVGLDPIKKYEPAWLGNFAQGTSSIVPGQRSVNRDNVEFVSRDGRYGIGLAGGEGIAHQHVVDGLGGKSGWDRLNRIGRTQGPSAVRAAVTGGNVGKGVDPYQARIKKSHGFNMGGIIDLGSFAYGGTIDAMVNIVRQKYPNIELTSHYRPGHGPYHGTYQATDWATTGAFGNSAEQLALAQDIAKTYPGSAELIYDHPGWTGNIKNGQNVGAFGQYYTMAQAGAHHHHVHWAMTDAPTMPFGGGVFKGGSSGAGGGGAINWLRDRVADVFDSVFGPIGRAIPEFPGLIGGVPKAAFDKMKNSVSDFIRGKADEAGTGSGVDTSGVVGSNVEIGQQLAARVGWTGAEWEALKELWTLESNWNNHAQNPTSTAYGIPQFLDQTWTTVGYSKTSDPATQIAAGIKYIQQRPDYGGLPSKALAAWWSRNPHWYDQGGEARGKGLLAKDTIKPERVLSPAQTQAFNDWMRGTHLESMEEIFREISIAFRGGDWGNGELSRAVGSTEVANAILETAENLGEFTRAATPILEDAAKDAARSGLDLFGLGGMVDIVDGVASKIHGIVMDDEVQDAIKTVKLDPDGRYSGREIEKKLKQLGVDVERIKSELDGGILGGLNIMV